MDFIKYCDLFDAKFHFYTTNYSSNFHLFGGAMFILYILISLLVFFLFSYDNLNKLNPITTISESPDIGYENININEEKIWIPWRITNSQGQHINHEGLLYPIINFVHGKKNNNKIMELEYQQINYKLCNETSMANNTDFYKIDISLDNLFCIENNDFYIGCSFNLGYICYIDINIYLCENGKNFNISDKKCSTFQDLYNYKNNSLIIEFYYPEIRFQPTNYQNPIQAIYRSHYYEIKHYNTKFERIFLRKNILSDERSLFSNNPKNKTYWGIDSIYGDAYFSDIYYQNYNASSKVFSLSIYLGKGLVYYTRYYKKFIQILSDIFPILNIILYIFRGTTDFIKMCWIRRRLFDLLFENGENTNFINNENKKKENKDNYNDNNSFIINFKKDYIKNRIKEIKNAIINNPNNNEINNPIFEKGNFSHKRVSHNSLNSILLKNRKKGYLNNKKKSNVSLSNLSNSNYGLNLEFKIINNNIKKTQIINKHPRAFLEKRRISRSYISKYNNKNILQKADINSKKRKKHVFPFIYYLSDFFLDRKYNINKFCFVSRNYLIIYKFLNKLYDISSFMILYKQFNIFKGIYAKGKFLEIINTNKKMNINNRELNEELSMNSLNTVFLTFSEMLLKEKEF